MDPPAPPAAGRRIFVGDVQGCRDELVALLERCAFRARRDQLCLVGDLVNKGPDSDGVVALARRLDALAVLGNHDLWWLAHRQGRPANRTWLAARPLIHLWDDLCLVHAGLAPTWDDATLERLATRLAPPLDLAQPPAEVEWLVNVRYCTADGRRPAADWPPPPLPFAPWDHHYRGVRTVVFGHWARRGLVVDERLRGLDTGCCYGGRLTAWIAEEDRLVQVDAARCYQPVR
ncbi:MAG: metallophosphatase [Nitrospirae bacterium CG06_land_8_20_14_3_00_70_43]|nr:MAG: metallophosphatase [Nitrospirae bacterium CG06_land_8_20_14_3_00_70_43]